MWNLIRMFFSKLRGIFLFAFSIIVVIEYIMYFSGNYDKINIWDIIFHTGLLLVLGYLNLYSFYKLSINKFKLALIEKYPCSFNLEIYGLKMWLVRCELLEIKERDEEVYRNIENILNELVEQGYFLPKKVKVEFEIKNLKGIKL